MEKERKVWISEEKKRRAEEKARQGKAERGMEETGKRMARKGAKNTATNRERGCIKTAT